MSVFGTRAESAADQLSRLREQAGSLVRDRVEAASGAAAQVGKAPAFRWVLDLLPLIAEYGGVAAQAFGRAREHGGEYVGEQARMAAQALPRGMARRVRGALWPVAVGALVLGVGYVAYRVARADGRWMGGDDGATALPGSGGASPRKRRAGAPGS